LGRGLSAGIFFLTYRETKRTAVRGKQEGGKEKKERKKGKGKEKETKREERKKPVKMSNYKEKGASKEVKGRIFFFFFLFSCTS